jgi:BolA protein
LPAQGLVYCPAELLVTCLPLEFSVNRPGPTEKIMREKLNAILAPSVLEINNESPMHGLPPEAEKHFRVVVVSETFKGRSRIERHQLINTVLAEELAGQVHALSIQAFTPEEWREREGKTHESPECLGGGKRER